MGTWGTAIFSDDLAADVRGDWRDAVLEGEATEDVTAQLIHSYEQAIANDDQSKVFWLALAAAQMETGRLLPKVRDRALAIIEDGGDVGRWAAEDAGLARQRERVLIRLAEKLRAPQPKPKKLRRPSPLAVRFELGDVILIRNQEARAEALFLVVDQMEYPRGNVHPVVEALLWEGGVIPTRKELERLQSVKTDDGFPAVDLTIGPTGVLRPHMVVATTHRRASVFTPEFGSVVERGVKRRASADYRQGALARGAPAVTTYMEWRALVRWIGGPAFRHEVEATRLHEADRRRLFRRKPRP